MRYERGNDLLLQQPEEVRITGMRQVQNYFRMLRHRWRSRSKFDIHSPFVYKIYAEILRDKRHFDEYKTIDIQGTAAGRKASRLLFRLARYYRPQNLLILCKPGSGLIKCLETGSPGSRIIRQDMGSRVLSGSCTFDMVVLENYGTESYGSDYFQTIMQHIHNDSVIIFVDPDGSLDKCKSWSEITKMPDVRITINLFCVGLAFVSDALSKEDFVLSF